MSACHHPQRVSSILQFWMSEPGQTMRTRGYHRSPGPAHLPHALRITLIARLSERRSQECGNLYRLSETHIVPENPTLLVDEFLVKEPDPGDLIVS